MWMTGQPRRTTPERARRRGRARFWRRLVIRLVAILACLTALVGGYGSYSAYRQVSTAELAAQQELGQISEQFAQISTTLLTVSASAGNAATSIDEARTSLIDASKTTRDFAGTLDQTASVINFTIPGFNIRPLDGLDTSFHDQARQLRDLATQVDQTNTALSQNDQDLRAISADVGRISRQMGDISTQLGHFASGPDSSLATITRETRILIIWSGIIHLLLFAIGVSLYLLTIEEAGSEGGTREGAADAGAAD
jgi:septal ring factor EnvC (AmiA/AmiB activator)